VAFFDSLGSIAGLVSIGLDAAGLFNQTKAEDQQRDALKAQSGYEASIARLNAMLRYTAAADAVARGKVAERQHRRGVDQLVGEQRATLASQGVEVTSGSAVDLVVGTQIVGDYEARLIEFNAERDAYGLRLEAESYERLAQLAEMRGDIPSTTGSTVLAGVSQIASNFATLSSQGVFR